jgi:hypothetical protein
VDDPPSPNDQNHDVGVFVEESMNWTSRGTVPSVTFETNAATGTEAPAHAGRNAAQRTRKRIPARAVFIRARWPVCQVLFFLIKGVCNTAPSLRALLYVYIYDANMVEARYMQKGVITDQNKDQGSSNGCRQTRTLHRKIRYGREKKGDRMWDRLLPA